MLGPPGTKSPQISEFKSQSPSPKIQSPCRTQSPRYRAQNPRSRCQDVVWRSQFSKNSFQDPRFNSQKPLDFLGWRPSDTRIQNPSPRDQRFPLVCPYTKSKSQDVQGCRSQVGFRIGHYSRKEIQNECRRKRRTVGGAVVAAEESDARWMMLYGRPRSSA